MHSVTDDLLRSFGRDLRARNRSPRTIRSYLDTARLLPVPLDEVTPDDVRDFIAAQLAQHSASTAAVRFRSLQQFFKWAVAEDIYEESPMRGMSPPTVADKPVPVLTLAQVRALLDACSGKSFEDRRDAAMFRLFLEPGGVRLSEIVGLGRDDVDLDGDAVTVLGKGSRQRKVPFGAKTGQALDRYLRARSKHPKRKDPALWLGARGVLTASGVAQMMRRRAAQAGLPHLHPHMFRHTAAHYWLAEGGQEGDAMRLFGWRSRDMLSRYAASAADARAHEAARRLNLGDRY